MCHRPCIFFSDKWPFLSLFLSFFGSGNSMRHCHRPCTIDAWPSTSRSRRFFKVRHVTLPISGSICARALYFFCFSVFLGLVIQWHCHKPCTIEAWPSTSRSRTFFKVRQVTFFWKYICLEHCKKVCVSSVIESARQKTWNEQNYNALAYILPEIGEVTCLTLKNVRDLDVEGHALVVQDLW